MMPNPWLTNPRQSATRLRQMYRDLEDASGLGAITLTGDVAWEWSLLDAALCEARGDRWNQLNKLRQSLVAFEARFERREVEGATA